MSPVIYGFITLVFCSYAFGWSKNPLVLLLLIAFFMLASSTITYVLTRVLRRAAILDKPNARSMHIIPVPRGGGWSYVILLTVGFGLALTCGFSQTLSGFDIRTIFTGSSIFSNLGSCISLDQDTLLLFAGFLLLAGVSWRDDCRGVPARFRLLAQFIAVSLPLSSYPIEFLFPDWVPYLFTHIFVLLAWVWFINLYNFMDGIDGITAMETISIGAVIALLGLKVFSNLVALNNLVLTLAIVLVSVSIGFLKYNWHPARIFLGDVGSVTIGYILGFCLLHIATMGYWHIALTLPLFYLADSGITLGRRLLRGDKIWEAHQSHLYQIAAKASRRHDVVVLKIAACNAILAAIAIASLYVGPWICLAAPIPVVLLYIHFAKQAKIAYLSIWHS